MPSIGSTVSAALDRSIYVSIKIGTELLLGVGPLSGSTIAALFYRFIKTLEYEVSHGSLRSLVNSHFLDGQPRR